MSDRACRTTENEVRGACSTGTSQDPLQRVEIELRDFAVAREWEQFHTPKNLVMALAGEVGELVELFQWLTPAESDAIMLSADNAARVREEIADVGLYLVRLASVLGVDLAAAMFAKMEVNAEKYPVEWARGHARKYDRPEEPNDTSTDSAGE